MSKTKITPENEKGRLQRLLEYEILDTESEPDFDDIVKCASVVCDTPVALISLLDSERQWFKAKVGIDVSETSREIAFCSHAILQYDLFEVKDAQADERFKDNPFVTNDPGVRFYAGVPLTDEDGSNLGTLCVVDTQPRKLTPLQETVLRTLAKQTITQIRLRHSLKVQKAAMNAKIQSEKLLKSFFDAAPMMMGVVEIRSGAIVPIQSNRATQQYYGDTHEHALSNLPYSAPDSHRLWLDNLIKARHSEGPVHFTFQHTAAGGNKHWIRATVTSISHADDRRGLYAFVAEDFTDQHTTESSLREERQRFERVIEGAHATVWDWHLLEDKLVFSEDWLERLGYENGEIPSTIESWTSLLHPDDVHRFEKKMQDFKATSERHFQFDYRWKHKSGLYHWVLTQGTCLRDAAGNPVRMTGWIIDIHDQRVYRERLESSEELLRALVHSGTTLIRLADQSGQTTFFNDPWLTFAGRPLETEKGFGWMQAVHADDQSSYLREYETAYADRKSYRTRYRLRDHDGAYHWIVEQGRPRFDSNGEFLGYICTCNDITDVKKQEEALAEQRNLLNSILNSLPIALVCKDVTRDFKFTLWNKATEAMTGISPAAAIGRTDYDLFPKEQADFFRNKDMAVVDNAEQVIIEEEPIDTHNQGRRYLRTIKVPIADANGKCRHLVSLAADITEQKDREEKLFEEKAKLESITRSLGDVVWMVDTNIEKVMYVTPSFEKVWEQSCESLLNDISVFARAVHPEDRDAVGSLYGGEKPLPPELTYRIKTPQGKVKWVWDRLYPLYDRDGHLFRIVGLSSDITEKRQQMELDREEKEKFESIVNNIPVMLILVDASGQPSWINAEWLRILGYDLQDCVDPEFAKRVFVDTKRFPSIPKALTQGLNGWIEFDLRAKSGEIVPTSWFVKMLSSGKAVAIGQDISLRRQQDELIREQQSKIVASAKMSSLGEMAGGIAHEINNPLAIIQGKAGQLKHLVQAEPVDKPRVYDGLDKIELTVDRIAKIVKGLRSFSRSGDNDPFTISSFQQILDDTLELCRKRFVNNGVELRVPDKTAIQFECRPVQISQILLNLLNNAFHAVHGTEEPWIAIEVKQTGHFVEISVSDSGTGIPPDVAARIMEPFFTTKPAGSGTGLGLSISKSMVDVHGGELRYDATSPHTRFVMILPLSQLSRAAS